MLQKMNMYLIIPNSIGLVISLFQIVLWFIFNNAEKTQETSKIIEEDSTKEHLLPEENQKLLVKT